MTEPAAPKRKKLHGRCICGVEADIVIEGGSFNFVDHVCRKKGAPPSDPKGDGVSPGGKNRSAPTFSSAKPTDCLSGHRHPSGMEANVCNRLIVECTAAGDTLFRQVKMPLLMIDPKPGGKCFTINVDFVIRAKSGALRYVEAKSPSRVSRDWPARAAAFAAQYGQAIEEVSG